MKYDFEFYYEGRVKCVHAKDEALCIFKQGGFYKAVCYFGTERPACFRLIEEEKDITSLK